MPEPRGKRRREPGPTAVEAQIEKLCRHEFLQGDKRKELLEYLVTIQRPDPKTHRGDRYKGPFNAERPFPTGKQIGFEFYRQWAYDHGERNFAQTPDDTEEAAKKLIAELDDALDRYYKTQTDALIVRGTAGPRPRL